MYFSWWIDRMTIRLISLKEVLYICNFQSYLALIEHVCVRHFCIQKQIGQFLTWHIVMVWVYVILRPMFGVSWSLCGENEKKNTITKINDNVTDAVLRSSKTKQHKMHCPKSSVWNMFGYSVRSLRTDLKI